MYKLCIILFALTNYLYAAEVLPAQAPTPIPKEKIPVLLNFGFGYGEYKIFDAYQKDSSTIIRGTELRIKGVIEGDTIKKYKEKVPAEWRNLVIKLGEASISKVYIPRTLYIQPKAADNIEAYGATWGFTPEIGVSLGPLSFHLSGGPILTYIHYRDYAQTDSVNFIRPGLRGLANFTAPLFTKYLILEVGGIGDIYVPQKFYGNESTWNVRSVYGMIHFRFPLTLEAAI